VKIAIVSLYPPRAEKHIQSSGVASYTKNLLRHMHLQPGDEVFVVCNKTKAKSQTYPEDGFTIARVFNRNFTFMWQIYWYLKKIQPDAVHVQHEIPLYGGIHTALMLPLLIWLLRQFGVVVTLHHVVSLQKIDGQFVRANKSNLPAWTVRAAFRYIISSIGRCANAIITHEEYFKDILVDEYKMDRAKIVVIPHGVEDFAPQSKQAARQKLNIAKDRHVVVFMGYLAEYKGVDLLLEGFARYAAADPHALLIIAAGKHPKFANDASYQAHYAAMQQKAALLIAKNQYQWIGFMPEQAIPDYYAACDATIYPYTISMSSSGPMSFAMGYEKPFLASDVFAHLLPSRILFAQNPDALAQKLAEFFATSAYFNDVARQLKAERLWPVIGTKTKALYYERLAA
jgi:glycosyltransferase involved in cell wall biosynthesis